MKSKKVKKLVTPLATKVCDLEIRLSEAAQDGESAVVEIRDRLVKLENRFDHFEETATEHERLKRLETENTVLVARIEKLERVINVLVPWVERHGSEITDL